MKQTTIQVLRMPTLPLVSSSRPDAERSRKPPTTKAEVRPQSTARRKLSAEEVDRLKNLRKKNLLERGRMLAELNERGHSKRSLAKAAGVCEGTVRQMILLDQLPPELKRRLTCGKLGRKRALKWARAQRPPAAKVVSQPSLANPMMRYMTVNDTRKKISTWLRQQFASRAERGAFLAELHSDWGREQSQGRRALQTSDQQMAAMTPIEQAVVRFIIWSQREIPDKTILAEALMQAEREVDPFHNPALRNKK